MELNLLVALVVELTKLGVVEVTIPFSGGGDSGNFEGVIITEPEGVDLESVWIKADKDYTLADLAMMLADHVMAEKVGWGWANNEGGRGHVWFNLKTREGGISLTYFVEPPEPDDLDWTDDDAVEAYYEDREYEEGDTAHYRFALTLPPAIELAFVNDWNSSTNDEAS